MGRNKMKKKKELEYVTDIDGFKPPRGYVEIDSSEPYKREEKVLFLVKTRTCKGVIQRGGQVLDENYLINFGNRKVVTLKIDAPYRRNDRDVLLNLFKKDILRAFKRN